MNRTNLKLAYCLSFALLALLPGCGGGGGGGMLSDGTGTAGEPSIAVFVADSASNNLAAFSMSTSTGVLSPIAGSPFAVGTQPTAVAVAQGKFLYVANAGSSTLSGFTIN